MSSRTTITISTRTKRILESLKGDESWDEFLFRLVAEFQRMTRERNRRRLAELLEAEFEEVRVRNGRENFS